MIQRRREDEKERPKEVVVVLGASGGFCNGWAALLSSGSVG